MDTVNGQLADIAARGFSGLIIDWYGQPKGPTSVDCPNGTIFCTEDGTTSKVAGNIGPSGLQFAIMEDVRGAICPRVRAAARRRYPTNPPDLNQPTCVQQRIQNDLKYADTAYFGNPLYYRQLRRNDLYSSRSFPFRNGLTVAAKVVPVLVVRALVQMIVGRRFGVGL